MTKFKRDRMLEMRDRNQGDESQVKRYRSVAVLCVQGNKNRDSISHTGSEAVLALPAIWLEDAQVTLSRSQENCDQLVMSALGTMWGKGQVHKVLNIPGQEEKFTFIFPTQFS